MHYCKNPTAFAKPERPWGDPSVIVLGYFDGETDGTLTCGICDQPYRFTLVDWDEQQDERIFALTRLTTKEHHAIVDAVERTYGNQSRRYWLPNRPEITQEKRVAAWDEIQLVFQAPSIRPEAIFLAEHVTGDILSLVLTQGSDAIESIDWWSRLKTTTPAHGEAGDSIAGR